MKALADTNPLVSALLRPDGNNGQILTRWRRGEFELAVSPATLNELSAVLNRAHIRKKYPFAEADIENHLSLLPHASHPPLPYIC